MVFNFRLVSDEVANFRREIKIDADATFLDLKNAICQSVNYDKNQMCSFFICDRNWEKEKEITMEDMGADSDQDVWLMDDTILSDILDDEGQKLLFIFDYMTDRAFFMELKNSIPGQTLKDPICTLSLGKAPEQNMDLDVFEEKRSNIASAEDFDEELYGSSEYDPEELDQEGLSEMDLEN